MANWQRISAGILITLVLLATLVGCNSPASNSEGSTAQASPPPDAKKAAAIAHVQSLLRIHAQDLLQRPLGTLDCVVINDAPVPLSYLAPDIDLAGNQYRKTTPKRFGNSNAEVLLVRRQNERIAGIKSAPFQITV